MRLDLPRSASVLIPTCQAERFLGRVLAALSEQDFALPRDVHVLESSSTDGTLAILAGWNETLGSRSGTVDHAWGDHAWGDLARGNRALGDRALGDRLPAGSHGGTFQSESGTRSKWDRGLEVLEPVPAGAMGFGDLVVLRKRRGRAPPDRSTPAVGPG